jgi:hypothetical protein
MGSSPGIAEKVTVSKPELTIACGTISVAINEVFERDELIAVAERIEEKFGLAHEKPIRQYSMDELRALIILRIEEFRDRQPDNVIAVKSIIDAATSAALDR